MYVELNHIQKRYGNYQASDDVSFGIEKGKLIGLLGPSGSGKTTILRMIAGLEHPDSGEIRIDGKVVNDIPASKRGIGFVFQNYALFRYMTVYDNIAFGLKIQKVDRKTIASRVMELVDLIGLRGLERRYPSQLSGGQRQRVAFARALAPNPQLLLLDEPFAAIDAKVRQELRSWLKEMISKLGVTSIFVTHDQDEAIEVADEIIITNRGHIEQMGTPIEIYRHPQTAFTASFFGQTSVLADYQKYHTFPAYGRRGKGDCPSGIPEDHPQERGAEVRQFRFQGRGGTDFVPRRLDRVGGACPRRSADRQAGLGGRTHYGRRNCRCVPLPAVCHCRRKMLPAGEPVLTGRFRIHLNLGNTTENLHADCVQSRQAGFVRYCPWLFLYCCLYHYSGKGVTRYV